MKDRWRPKEWRNWYTPPEKKIFTESDVLIEAVDSAFEAGADAMLEALRKEGTHLQWAEPGFNIPGVVAFIPDEKK